MFDDKGQATLAILIGLAMVGAGLFFIVPPKVSPLYTDHMSVSVDSVDSPLNPGETGSGKFTISATTSGEWKWTVRIAGDYVDSGTMDGYGGSKSVSFTAPSSTGSYRFEVTVEDVLDETYEDTVSDSAVFDVVEPDGGGGNPAPSASFSYSPTEPDPGDVVIFDAHASSGNGDEIVAYRWDLGDGTAARGVTVNHAYRTGGTYDVTLVVEDTAGQTDQVTRTVYVSQSPKGELVAMFDMTPPSAKPFEDVTFDASPSTAHEGEQIVSYRWNLGDGTKATGKTVTHSYDKTGIYNVKLTVEEGDGDTDSLEKTIEVSVTDPVPRFEISPKKPTPGDTVTFDASGSKPLAQGIMIKEYKWEFGDGTSATGQKVGHSYEDVGDYPVKLTVTTNVGTQASVTRTVSVKARKKRMLPLWASVVLVAVGATLAIGGVLKRRKVV